MGSHSVRRGVWWAEEKEQGFVPSVGVKAEQGALGGRRGGVGGE